MKQIEPTQIKLAQDQQAFWASFASNFEDTPLFESFQEWWAENEALWWRLERLAAGEKLRDIVEEERVKHD